MAQYSIKIDKAELNQHGLAKEAGWMTVYHAHPLSREYIHASMEYLPQGVGLPEYSYTDAPELSQDNAAIVRTKDGSHWQTLPDHRGQTAYDTATRQATLITEPGELPAFLTLLPPGTDFDIWDGKQWNTDIKAQKAAAVQRAENHKAQLTAKAFEHIATLERAVKLGIATQEEKKQLTSWEAYSVLLRRVDIENAPSVTWPTVPATGSSQERAVLDASPHTFLDPTKSG
ncbi:tail fiber assembly protein [Sodalis sp. RH19]|uniref:tail fiber assembly protein n=1 Tax=Sodalis sp. RH19 TaxID=3394334 RepID=UPI0039B4CFBF